MRKNPNTRRNPLFSGKLFGLLLLVIMLISTGAFASHFRFGNIAWQRVPGQPMKIQFTVTQAWRGNSLSVIIGGTTGGLPNLGSTVSTGTTLSTGISNPNIDLVVTSVHPAANLNDSWIYGVYTYTETYTSTGTFTALFGSCCRISTLSNNHDEAFEIKTVVTVGNSNDAPVSTIPPIVNMGINQTAATYQIPATDPNGDPLTFSLTPAGTWGINTVHPSGLSISSTGLITFNTQTATGHAVGQQYCTNVTVTDNKGASVQLDFLLEIVGQSTPPFFDYTVTPANTFTYQIQPLQPLTFNVKAADNDAGDVVALSGVGVPVGASFAPASGNPITQTFSWTPTAGQLGTYQVNFVAQDNNGQQANTVVNILVSARPKFIGPTLGNGSGICLVPGVTYNATFTADDPDPTDVVSLNVLTPTVSGMSFSSALPTAAANPVTINMSLTPPASAWGVHVLTVEATDSHLETAQTNVTFVVDNSPTITSSPVITAIVGAPYSYIVNGADLDIPFGDHLTIESFTAPAWLSVVDNNNNTFTISGTPTLANLGANPVTIELEDAIAHSAGTHCGSVAQNFTVNVSNACNLTAGPVVGSTTFCTSNTIYIGYGPTSATLSVNPTGGTAPLSYLWTPGGGTTKSVSVSPTTNTNYSVTVTDANGCTSTSSTSITVKVKDVRCGNNNNKVMVCHNGNNALCISPNAVPAHISNHGDCLGDCTSAFARNIGSNHSAINLEEGNIVVFPNPARGTINVELKETGSAYQSYQIMDINGRIVLSQQLSGDIHADLIKVDISKLVPGMYIIRAVTENGANLTKFTVD